ncbi:hypothetical protein SDC9_167715 [bioreactor metagenome]|uniref:Uncharacterized protein n=1 Tax=bioreactor metagenome TaxID=1076179 RepID=A0A645G0I3_9ZZZZ
MDILNRAVDEHDVVANIVQVIGQKLRESHRAPNAENINSPRPEDGVYRAVEALVVDHLYGCADIVHIRRKHRFQHVLLRNIRGEADALHAGQAMPDEILKRLLQRGIAVEPQHIRKAHHGGLGYANPFAELCGRHKRRVVIGIEDVFRNPPLPLGKGRVLLFHHRKQCVHRASFLPNRVCALYRPWGSFIQFKSCDFMSSNREYCVRS